MKIFVLLFVLCGHISLGQVLHGFVVDKNSSGPLEFATIGIIGTNIGTISDKTGRFNLDAGKLHPNDQFRISFISYQSEILTVSDFKSGDTIRLSPASLQLSEVVVNGKLKRFTIGETTTSSRSVTGWGGFSAGSGGERGILLEPKKAPIYPAEIIFHVARCAYDSVLLRLHIRAVENGIPGEELLQQNVYYIFKKGTDVARIDVSDTNVAIRGACVVSLEWVKAFGRCNGADCNVQFSLRRGKGIMYSKEASEGHWNKLEDAQPSIAITCLE
jgi:hypothetical protein